MARVAAVDNRLRPISTGLSVRAVRRKHLIITVKATQGRQRMEREPYPTPPGSMFNVLSPVTSVAKA